MITRHVLDQVAVGEKVISVSLVTNDFNVFLR